MNAMGVIRCSDSLHCRPTYDPVILCHVLNEDETFVTPATATMIRTRTLDVAGKRLLTKARPQKQGDPDFGNS